jgi:hypothetical protein
MCVHALPIDVRRRRGVPRLLRHVICVVQGPLLLNTTASLSCPALAPVQDRLRPLFISGTQSLRWSIWQQDVRDVVRFVHECFVFRSSLLVPAG